MPFGAPNKFEEIVTRIKSAQARCGADHAGRRRQRQLQPHLRRLRPRQGHRAGSRCCWRRTRCTASAPTPAATSTPACPTSRTRRGEANKKFKADYLAKFGDKAPQLGLIGADCYGGIYCAKALVTKAGGTDAKKCMAASEGLTFPTALRDGDDARPPGRQDDVSSPPARAPSSTSSRPSRTSRAATSARP